MPTFFKEQPMTNILPVMRRAEILPAPIAEKLAAAAGKIQGFRGLSISTFVGPEAEHLLREPLYIFEIEGEIETYKWGAFNAEDDALFMLADLGMSTVSSTVLRHNTEHISVRLPITAGPHSVSMLILPQATIMHHGDAGSYVYDHEGNFREQAERETTRAPLCTLLLKPNLTAHQMIEEHPQIQQAMWIYRQKNYDALHCLDNLPELILTDPTREDLAQAENLWM